MTCIRLELPPAPSANHLFRNAPGRGRVKTERYRKWINAAGWSVNAALSTAQVRAITGPVEIVLGVGEGVKDIANAEKAAVDLLVRHRIIQDDNRNIVRRLVIEPTDRKDLVVIVKPYAPSATPLFGRAVA